MIFFHLFEIRRELKRIESKKKNETKNLLKFRIILKDKET